MGTPRHVDGRPGLRVALVRPWGGSVASNLAITRCGGRPALRDRPCQLPACRSDQARTRTERPEARGGRAGWEGGGSWNNPSPRESPPILPELFATYDSECPTPGGMILLSSLRE